MFKGEIWKAREDGLIARVVVARMFSTPGQTEAKLSPNDSVREPKNYKYLLLFIPNKTLVPVALQKPWHFFIFLNRLDKHEEIRWYKSLFTASQDIAEWGFRSFEYMDLTGYSDLEAAFDEIKAYLTKKKVCHKPVRRFMDDLVNIERGLPIIPRRRKAGISI